MEYTSLTVLEHLNDCADKPDVQSYVKNDFYIKCIQASIGSPDALGRLSMLLTKMNELEPIGSALLVATLK
jgi:hypothetical protein